MNNQGKRKDQIESAYKLAFWSIGGFIAVVLVSFIDCASITKFNKEVSDGIANDPRPANHLSNYTIPDKNDTDWTGTTQGELTKEEMLSKEPDCIYYDTIEVIEEDGVRWYTLDTIKMQREADSIDAYMKYWYEVLDTNSNGEIDDMEGMDCGGKVHDSIIEWLEE